MEVGQARRSYPPAPTLELPAGPQWDDIVHQLSVGGVDGRMCGIVPVEPLWSGDDGHPLRRQDRKFMPLPSPSFHVLVFPSL